MEGFADHLRAFRRPQTVASYDLAARKRDGFVGDQGYGPSTRVDFAKHLLTDGEMAPRSVHLMLSGARTYMTWLKQRGVEVSDQLPVPSIRVKKTIPPVLRGDQLGAYMRACADLREPYRTMARILPISGLRIREACNLRSENVRPTRDAWWFQVKDSKGDDRDVPLLPAGNALLRNYIRDVRPRLAGGPYLFPSRKGGPAHPPVAREGLRRIRTRIGHPRLTPHLLRHTYGTILEEASVPALEIMGLLGHNDLRTTKDYTHPSPTIILARLKAIKAPWVPYE